MRPGKTVENFQGSKLVYLSISSFFSLLFLFCFAIGKFEHVMHTVL